MGGSVWIRKVGSGGETCKRARGGKEERSRIKEEE
jgi:hypothetical protein